MQKVLRIIPIRFNAKVSALEERKDLDTITMDDLHRILTTYEMETYMDQSPKKEVAFKASKNTKEDKHTSMPSANDESDEGGENFVKKMTREF